MSGSSERRRVLKLSVALALLATCISVGPAAAVKTPDGIGCDPYPGTTTIHWYARDHWARVTLAWWDDVSGAQIGAPIDIVRPHGNRHFSAATPQYAGTLDWSARYYDRSGVMQAVAGGVCF